MIARSYAVIRKSRFALLETLEIRTLLSAAIQLTGNATPIANHDTKPSALDFTDFGFASTTADAAIGTVHRTFTIINTGDAPLTLSIPGPIIISGPNTADFAIESQPATTIDAATSSTFTIDFVPKATGLRKATLTVKTNDPANPTFTFAIQGLAIKTTNDTSNHLQVATTTIVNTHTSNSFAGLPQGEFDYTGRLLSGSVVFDNTSNIQFTALELELDTAGNVTGNILSNGSVSGTLIPGLIQSLKGIKIGETRDVLVPTDLAYGSDPGTQYPDGVSAGDAILFTVTARPPTLAVYGNMDTPSPLRIAPGDTTPSADDATLFGHLALANGTQNSLDGAFALFNVGNGSLNLDFAKALTFSGTGAKAFSGSAIDTSSGFFTITFHPTAAGTQTAIAHLRTTDPLHPDFNFALSGSSDPFVDLTDSLGVVSFPANVISGAATKYKIPVTFTNSSNQNLPAAFPLVPVQIYLHNTGDDSMTLISDPALTTTAFRGLAARASRKVTFMQAIPITVAGGNYEVVVTFNNNFTISENNSNNNSAHGSPLAITQGIISLAGTLGTSTFPAMIAASSTLSGNLALTFSNTGNLGLPVGQKFSIQLVVIDTNSLAQTNLGAAKVVTAALLVGKSFTTSILASLDANTLAAGDYQLAAVITPVTALTGISNLTLTTNAASAIIPLTVTGVV